MRSHITLNCSVHTIYTLARTDEPCLIDSLGGSTLSCLAQHKLSLPQEAIVVGDFNSSLRLLVIPPGFTVPLSNELEVCVMPNKFHMFLLTLADIINSP